MKGQWRPVEPVAQVPSDTPRIEAWLISHAERRLSKNELRDLLRAWESSSWRDGTAVCPSRRIKLTPDQRAAVKELLRRFVAAEGGRVEARNVDLVADGDTLKVVLPTRVFG